MIKDNSQYIPLIVPNEYKCVYYNILNVLGNLGEDLLSSCTATCKGRAITGFACYNMFNAACACYYLGFIKKARVLISYIKAQLEISCNKFIIHENSIKDEFVYLKVPIVYEQTFECLLNNLAIYGQELLDDCSVSCKGNNKNLVNCWNLFQAAIIAYDNNDEFKAEKIINYINDIFDIGGTKYFTISVNCIPEDAIVEINGARTKTLTIAKNQSCLIVVSKEDYKTYRNEFTVTKDETINVTLQRDEERLYTVNVNVLPESALNKQAIILNINTGEQYMATGQFKSGTRLLITGNAQGYNQNSLEYTVNPSDAVNGVITKNISLTQSLFNVAIHVFERTTPPTALLGCTVVLIDTNTQQRYNPYSSGGGIYSFQNIPAGSYQVSITLEDFVQDNPAILTVNGDTDANYYMTRTAVRLTILTVNDKTDASINDATIYVDNNQLSGNFADVSIGQHTVRIEKTGFLTIQETINVTQSDTVTYRLKNYFTIVFNVQKEDIATPSQARQGVTVSYQIGSQTPVSVVNDNNTSYEIPLNTTIVVTGSANDYETASRQYSWAENALINEDSSSITFSLSRLYTINSNAVDSVTGDVISGATVTIQEDNS